MSSDGRNTALAGVRVVDISTILAAPVCAQILGDFGADIIKIEAPRGDESRRVGPRIEGAINPHFAGVNRNKRSLALDLSQPAGRDVLLRLLEGADVLLENLKPGTLRNWGLGYDEVLSVRFPKLIHCGVSGFGETGPWSAYPGYDAVAQAMAGWTAMNGEPEGAPVRMAASVADLATAMNALAGILIALRARDHSGRGQFIDVALFDSALALHHPFAVYWAMMGETHRPQRTGNFHPSAAPYEVFESRDGFVSIAIANDAQFVKLCEVLDCPHVAKDARFRQGPDRIVHIEALREILRPLFKRQESVPFAERLLAAKVPAAPVLEMPEAFHHPQAVAREMLIEGDRYKGIGFPIKMSETPAAFHRPPPYFGEHSRQILEEAGYGKSEIDALVATGIVPTKTK